VSRSLRSEQQFERSLRVLPGGVDSPVRAFNAVGGTPRVIARYARLLAETGRIPGVSA